MNKPYLIRATRNFYAGKIHNGRVLYFGQLVEEYGFDTAAPLKAFPNRDAAKAAIEKIEAETYYLACGEYARPTLRAVPVSAAPEHIRDLSR